LDYSYREFYLFKYAINNATYVHGVLSPIIDCIDPFSPFIKDSYRKGNLQAPSIRYFHIKLKHQEKYEELPIYQLTGGFACFYGLQQKPTDAYKFQNDGPCRHSLYY